MTANGVNPYPSLCLPSGTNHGYRKIRISVDFFPPLRTRAVHRDLLQHFCCAQGSLRYALDSIPHPPPPAGASLAWLHCCVLLASRSDIRLAKGLLSGTSPLPGVCRLDSWPDSISVAVEFRHIPAVDETLSAPLCSCCPSYPSGSLAVNKLGSGLTE